SNADTYQEKPLQIILCGQPELLTMLRRPELRALQQRVVKSCSLRPLSLPEVRAYVAERLYAAGFRDSTYPFPTAALDLIFHYSKGVPRLINLLCDACLSAGYKSQSRTIQSDIVEQAAADLEMEDKHKPSFVEERITIPVSRSYSGTRSVASEP